MSDKFDVTTAIKRNKVAAIAQALGISTEDAVKMWADSVLAHTQPHVPVQTGALLASGHTETVSPLHVDVVFDAPYAGYVHFGTRHMAARPFLAQGQSEAAVEANDIVARVKNAVENVE